MAINLTRSLVVVQEQEEALEEAERRMKEVQIEKEKEAELNRRQNEEVKYLKEKEERSRREKEVSSRAAHVHLTMFSRHSSLSSAAAGRPEGGVSGGQRRGGASSAPGVQVQLRGPSGDGSSTSHIYEAFLKSP